MAKIEWKGSSLTAGCWNCGTIASFESALEGRRFGYLAVPGELHKRSPMTSQPHRIFQLLRCASCKHGALAVLQDWVVSNKPGEKIDGCRLEQLWPPAIDRLEVPEAVPDGIRSEFREAEDCIAFQAHRAASALFRSTLEKALKSSGYGDPPGKRLDLFKRIEAAASDGVITDSRRQKAQDEVRVLGNEVVHDDWKAVSVEDAEAARHYTQRVLEDLYDDRQRVEALVTKKGRTLPAAGAAAGAAAPAATPPAAAPPGSGTKGNP